ncbi:MAG: hypothetical protein HUK26_06560, partial [Duodenibacillus sp.]|nr:hypothetical protein [Duodenibacillus sp.]
ATRELFYTAVTRVKDREAAGGAPKAYGDLAIFGTEAVVREAAARSVERDGALNERIASRLADAPSGPAAP